MKIHYLSDTWPWFGEHQSYRRLVDHVKGFNEDIVEVRTRYDLLNRLLGKAYIKLSPYPFRRDTVFAAAEFLFKRYLAGNASGDNVFHVLFFDTHFRLFEDRDHIQRGLIATLHHPVGRAFPDGMEKALSMLPRAIVLVEEAVSYYEGYLGKGKVSFIPHGVDVDFFSPSEEGPAGPPSFLFTGQNGRNLEMTARIIKRFAGGKHNVSFHLLAPEALLKGPPLSEIAHLPGVKFHDRTDESGLLRLYRKCHALFLPMNDSGANNAVVEALAAGLPVITTDVGGIRDYGGGDVYPVVKNNDDDGMVHLIESYMADSEWRDTVAADCRKFAVENLAWEKVAQRHLEVYEELMNA